ncbi:MAG: hypothetical protein IPG99_08885 [Ignavibacteria bacterium]|nr:hypothetical protein [Ignavibacteria bacterium]
MIKSLLLLFPALPLLAFTSWSFLTNSDKELSFNPPFLQMSGSPFLQEVMVYPSAELQAETPLAAHPTDKNVFAASAITGVYPGGYTSGFYRTTNGGTSWTGTNAIKNLSGGIITTIGDPQIVISNEYRYIMAYLASSGAGGLKVAISYSTNNGANFTSPYFVPGVDTADKVVMSIDDYPQSPNFGRCYIAYSEKGGTYFSYSTNSGTTWSSARRICPTNRYSRVGASIATGPLGEVYVSWPYYQSSADYLGFAKSTASSSSASKSYQLFNQLNIDKSGNVNVFYIDTRDTPTNDSFTVYMSRSMDGGANFIDTRASNHKFKLKQLPTNQRLFGVPSYIGSYIGLASSSDKIIGLWYDNVDEQYRAYSVVYPLSTNMSLKSIPQGIYDDSFNRLKKRDSATVVLHSSQPPYQTIDSASAIIDSSNFTAALNFSNISSGNYFIEVKHKNSISVWSNAAVSIISGGNNFYDFTLAAGSSYGSNVIQLDSDPVRFGMYSGEVNSDNAIDVTDVSIIENYAFNYASGNVITDINGANFVDVTDIAFADFGSENFVLMISP